MTFKVLVTQFLHRKLLFFFIFFGGGVIIGGVSSPLTLPYLPLLYIYPFMFMSINLSIKGGMGGGQGPQTIKQFWQGGG